MKMDIKRLDALFLKCRNIVKAEGIPASKNITGPIINGRIRSRFGKCTKIGTGYEIEVSSRILDCGEKEIETILLHELLHTCPKCMNHGQTWKRYAAQLNKKYGYEISVKTSYEKLGIENPGSREPVKYLIVCTKCGQEFPRRRKSSITQHIDRYQCGKCGGKLEIHPILLHLVDENLKEM